MIHFPISGIDTYWWLPLTVAFFISTFCSLGGVSGAFLLLPFQVSVLGFTGPAVSPTNMVFNIFAIPSGVYRYAREKRLILPLVITMIVGTLPGVFIGVLLRVNYLPDPRHFKLFIGAVLLYVGIRMIIDILGNRKKKIADTNGKFEVQVLAFNLRIIRYKFKGVEYSVPTISLFALCLIVGIIGGTYGIGGGSIIAPFLVSIFGLPVYTIAGAALLGTFVTSIVGVIFYAIIAPFYAHTGLAISPDWSLGALFGIGGAAGMYVGARIQRFVPEQLIKAILAVAVVIIITKYILDFLKP